MGYVGKMKGAINDYLKEARIAQRDIATIEENYKPEYAKKVKGEVLERLQGHYNAAVSKIRQAQEEGEKAAAAWGKLDGAQITKDAELLKYRIAPKDFDGLVERYRDNYTMSNLLYQYGEQKNKEAQEKAGGSVFAGDYNLSNIETLESHIHHATATGNTAVDVLDRLSIEPGYMRGIDSPMAKAAYDGFMGLDD